MKIHMMVAAIALSSALGLSAMESGDYDENNNNMGSDTAEDYTKEVRASRIRQCSGYQITAEAALGNLEKVSELLDSGVAIDSKATGMKGFYPTGLTALQAAVIGKQDKVVELLLERGANVNATSDGNDAPLGILVVQGKFEMAKKFIAKGAFLECSGIGGPTVLFDCAGEKGAALVFLLVGAGAEVDATDKSGRTCLTLAIHHGDTFMEKALIQAGANEEMAREAIEQKVYRGW